MKKREKSFYLTSAQLAVELQRSQDQGNVPTEQLCIYFMQMAEHFSHGPKYCRYNDSLKADLKSAALLKCIKNIKNYKPEYSSKCFNYYTRCIEHAFWELLHKHYQHLNLLQCLREHVASKSQQL